MTVTDVRTEHLDGILAIENACFSLPWTRAQLESQMNADNCVFLAALGERNEVMGYVGLMTVLDEGYISNIAVAPEYRRRHVADALIAELIGRNRSSLAFLTLEVRESNIAAIALYAKHGFRVVGKRNNYYEKPKEAALLMTLFFRKEDTPIC